MKVHLNSSFHTFTIYLNVIIYLGIDLIKSYLNTLMKASLSRQGNEGGPELSCLAGKLHFIQADRCWVSPCLLPQPAFPLSQTLLLNSNNSIFDKISFLKSYELFRTITWPIIIKFTPNLINSIQGHKYGQNLTPPYETKSN